MLHVPKSLKGVAVFSFKRLCGEARGASDYLALAQTYHTVILVGIPRMGPDRRNEAARFVTLIDALYENKVKLLVAADAVPEQLYEAGDGRFEFERTVSRLNEMQSADYMALGHGEE
jgi:cell division protein ZapE